jgi:hypothetical protein
MTWIRNSLLVTLALGVAWAAVAGLNGYTLGSPPRGLDAVASCYHVMRVDFIVPMWKPADPSVCGSPSSSAPAPTDSADGGQCAMCGATTTSTTPPTPAPMVCDDPNWRTDGNQSGEMRCP